jgi:diketogulonate reductase-like aldo/keto reductase
LGYSPKYRNISNNKYLLFAHKAYNKIRGKLLLESRYFDAVVNSLRTDFTLLDFSAAYGNEQLIGKAIKKYGIERKI